MRLAEELHITTTILMFFLVTSLMAQKTERPLLADVEIQKIFIDANREKLLEHYEDAAYLFSEVLKKDPQNHSAAYELSRMYDVMEEDAMALKSIEKAVRLAPDNVWYKDFYAAVLERNNKSEKAAAVYGQLSKNHPDNEYFLFKQAFHYVKANKPEKAVVIYDKLEKMVGVNEELTKKKYTLYYGMGDDRAAVAEIRKLINTYPAETSYLHILAEFYKKEKKTKEAQKVYAQILEIDPRDAEAKMATAGTLKKGGEHTEYLNSIRPIINKSDVNIDLKVKELFPYITMLGTSTDQEFKTTALALGKDLTLVHPQNAKAHSLYADMLYHASQPEEALKYYESTLKLDKSVYAVWEQIMYIHIEADNMKSLIQVTEKAMDVFPNQAKIYYMNGIAQSATSNHSEASNMFEQALMMSGKNTALKYDICNRLGVEYASLKKYARSDKMFKRALELSPNGHSALYNYSFQLGKRGENLQLAREMAFKSNEIKEKQPYYLANLGHIHFLLKNYKEARTWLEKSIGNGGDEIAEVLEVYGDVLYENGDKSQAVENWKKSKELGNTSNKLDQKISDQKL